MIIITDTHADKSSWTTSASGVTDTYVVTSLLDNNYGNYHANTDRVNPWFQIDLQQEYTVRGVKLFVREEAWPPFCCRYRMGNTEFRVGNTDVTGTGADEMIL